MAFANTFSVQRFTKKAVGSMQRWAMGQVGRHCLPSGGVCSHLKFNMDSRRAAVESPDSSFRK